VSKPSTHFRRPTELARQAIQTAMLLDDARHAQLRPIDCHPLLLKKRTPPQTIQ
jgi:hypothetical protein